MVPRKQSTALRRKIERSVVLLQEERKTLLGKLPTMTAEELEELEGILASAEKINWEEELPAFEKQVEEAIDLAEKTERELLSLTPSSHA